MPFSHACFISYRHRPDSGYQAVVEDLYTTLRSEVVTWMNQLVYLDVKRLEGGDYFNRALAKAMCESVCMVVFYIPPYFDLDYTYCAREFKAMEQLERQRLKALGIKGGPHGLIIPVVYRGWDQFPQEIKDRRLCYNFEQYTMGTTEKVSEHPEGKIDIKKIAKYIFERQQEMLHAQNRPHAKVDPCAGCGSFAFPTANKVVPWLQQVLSARPRTPARRLPSL